MSCLSPAPSPPKRPLAFSLSLPTDETQGNSPVNVQPLGGRDVPVPLFLDFGGQPRLDERTPARATEDAADTRRRASGCKGGVYTGVSLGQRREGARAFV